MRARVLLALCCLCPAGVRAAQPGTDPIELLVSRIEEAVSTGNARGLRALAALDVDSSALDDFVATMTSPPVTHATVRERDRALLENGQQRLLLEIFADRASEGTVTTWRVDVKPSTLVPGLWQIAALEHLTVISGLHRLELNREKEFEVRNLVVRAPDLLLELPAGQAFVGETREGPTVMVLLGHGRMTFSPKPEAEHGQVRIFCGSDALATDFTAAYLRLNPANVNRNLAGGTLTLRAVDRGDFRKAEQIFDTYRSRSFEIDLMDLSADRWSLVPNASDFVAEIVTKKYGALTYARALSEPEDISVFDRRRRRNISIYASDEKLASRGRFFSEDEHLDYQISRYDIDATFAPDRQWVDGIAKLTLRVQSPGLTTMTLRLADSLVVRSVNSRYGRLLHFRVVGQNSVLIGFPTAIGGGETLDLTFVYGGRLAPQSIDREGMRPGQQERTELQETSAIPLEPRYLYSNRSYWYPQGPVTGYATATLKLTVPSEFDVIASGAQQGVPLPAAAPAGQHPRRQFVFSTSRPARYLACIISRFSALEAAQLNLPSSGDTYASHDGRDAVAAYGGGMEAEASFNLLVQANPRQLGRARSLTDRTAAILKFYTSLVGEAPYSSFTLALTEADLPGGHSPAYFAVLDQPLPMSPVVWKSDPVSFDFSGFFLAHEVAHQWWGQAVGWKNYHEQWLSEGFAQYFAALYAQRERGNDEFDGILRQMRRWAIQMSPEGPVYLGYRLGHIKADGRVFRAIVYNKGAMVLHMLRRLVGDQAFFAGLRRFYTTWRYQKAGTDDFRVAMESASSRTLDRFFEGWIYGTAVPRLRFSSTVDPTSRQIVVRFEHRADVLEVPVTVTLLYADGTSEDVVVAVADRVTERTLPLKGALRGIDVNRDNGAVAEIER
jgi:peptidase M1-like protein